MAPTTLKKRVIVERSISTGYLATFVYAVLAATVIVLLLRFDRRPPLVYLDIEITPQPAHVGGDIAVTRTVLWTRPCEGRSSTELVTPKGYVIPREHARPYTPEKPGRYTVLTTISLPMDLLSASDTMGTATLRGVVTFAECGITSRFWPLVVSMPYREFDVRH